MRTRACKWVLGLALLMACAPSPPSPRSPLQLGADRLWSEPYFSWIRGKRLGLITNQTGVDSRLQLTADLLRNSDQVHLVALFAPEHGLEGTYQAGEAVLDQPRYFSLYGTHRAPTPQMLMGIDVLLYDIQDVGVRFYTYISTLFECLKAASEQGIPFIVLDRPNPIGGLRVEGPMLEPSYRSFVGIFPIPVRYGLTVGELARLYNQEASLEADLKVVPLSGWERSHWFDDLDLQWIPPSPNMPTLQTAVVYPGFCLLEGTNLSEGRGTTRPFELFGAPWLEAATLTDRLNQLKLPGVLFRIQSFRPTFSKYQGELCRGVQIHVTDRDRFRPIETALAVLSLTYQLHPQEFTFQEEFFDRLVGNSWIRKGILAGEAVASLAKRWAEQTGEFEKERRKYLLYP